MESRSLKNRYQKFLDQWKHPTHLPARISLNHWLHQRAINVLTIVIALVSHLSRPLEPTFPDGLELGRPARGSQADY